MHEELRIFVTVYFYGFDQCRHLNIIVDVMKVVYRIFWSLIVLHSFTDFSERRFFKRKIWQNACPYC